MGFYIECPSPRNKVAQLVELHQAQICTAADAKLALDSPTQAPVCVKENGLFDAAAYIFSEAEFRAFSYPDHRPTHWLVMDRAKAEQLSGYKC